MDTEQSKVPTTGNIVVKLEHQDSTDPLPGVTGVFVVLTHDGKRWQEKPNEEGICTFTDLPMGEEYSLILPEDIHGDYELTRIIVHRRGRNYTGQASIPCKPERNRKTSMVTAAYQTVPEAQISDLAANLDAIHEAIVNLNRKTAPVATPVGIGAGGGDIRAFVKTAWQSVLGSFPANEEVFKRQLAQRFVPKEQNGRTIFVNDPTAGVGQIEGRDWQQNGPLLRLQKRMGSAGKELLILLKELEPLCDCYQCHDDDIQAQKAVVIELVENINEELTRASGPRAIFVDQLLSALYHKNGVLPALFALLCYDDPDDTIITNREDEMRLANVHLLMDQVDQITLAWKTYRGEDRSLSQVLDNLHLRFQVVNDALNDVQDVLAHNSFNETDAKIHTLLPDQDVTMDDLTSLFSHFANEKGPNLLRKGQAYGLGPVYDLASQFAKLANDAGSLKKYPFTLADLVIAWGRMETALQDVADGAHNHVPRANGHEYGV